jgi:hypothetical protein
MRNNENTADNNGAAQPPTEAAPNEAGNNNNESNGKKEAKAPREEEEAQDPSGRDPKHEPAELGHGAQQAGEAAVPDAQRDTRRNGVGHGRVTRPDRVARGRDTRPMVGRRCEAKLHDEIRQRLRLRMRAEGGAQFLFSSPEQRAAELCRRARIGYRGVYGPGAGPRPMRGWARYAARVSGHGVAIAREVRSRLRGWRERWMVEERNEVERGMTETHIREGIESEMAEEFAEIDRREEQVLKEINGDLSWATSDMDMQVEHRYMDMDCEKDRILDEMDRHLDRELSDVERQLAERRLEGEE